MQNYLSSLFAGNTGTSGSFDNFYSKYGKKNQPVVGPRQSTSVGAVGSSGGYDTVPGSNPGATTTQPVKPVVASSPAKSAFVSTLASQGNPLGTTGSTAQPITGNATTPSGAVVDSKTGATISTPASSGNSAYTDAYTKYISSLTPSDDMTTSASNLAKLKLQNEQESDTALERPGETIGSAAGESARVNRNYSYAIDAESNRLNSLTGKQTANTNAAKARLDYEKSLQGDQKPFAVGDDTYQYNPTTGQYEKTGTKASANAGFTLSAGENRYDANGKLIASGGPKPLTATQEATQLANTEKEKSAQQSASQSLGLINGLLSGDRYKAISGALQTGSIPFLGDRAAVNEYNQLKAQLALGARSLIKGTGAISDYESKTLNEAASALSRLTNEGEMKKALQKIRGVIQTNNGGSTNVIIKDSSGKVLGQGDLNSQDIYEAVKDGNTIEYL